MIDILISDLEKEMAAAKTEEGIAQKEYEDLMKESATKRAEDSKSIQDKESSKADLVLVLDDSKAERAATSKELSATNKYITALHAECDFLIKYFDVRKEARAGEVDSLSKAKAVLSGADFS